jgi:hypothetical protein
LYFGFVVFEQPSHNRRLSQGQIAKIENCTRPVMDCEPTAIVKVLKVQVMNYL